MTHTFEMPRRHLQFFYQLLDSHFPKNIWNDIKVLRSQKVAYAVRHKDHTNQVIFNEKKMHYLIVVRTTAQGEYVEMTWHMLKDEIMSQNDVARAA